MASSSSNSLLIARGGEGGPAGWGRRVACRRDQAIGAGACAVTIRDAASSAPPPLAGSWQGRPPFSRQQLAAAPLRLSSSGEEIADGI